MLANIVFISLVMLIVATFVMLITADEVYNDQLWLFACLLALVYPAYYVAGRKERKS